MNQEQHEQPKFGLPVCPHCGKRLNPLVAWLYKTKGCYACPACSKLSQVLADPKTPIFGIVAVVISLAIFLIFLFTNGKVPLWAISLLVAPFFLFTLLAPFLVRLKAFPKAPEPSAERAKRTGSRPGSSPRTLPRVTDSRPQPSPASRRPAASRTPPPARTHSIPSPSPERKASPYAHPASRPPQERNLAPQKPVRSTPPPTASRPVQMNRPPAVPPTASRPVQTNRPSAVPPTASRPVQTNRPPAAPPTASRPVQTNRPGHKPNTRPNLFDTAEFGKRAPRDFSGYQDK